LTEWAGQCNKKVTIAIVKRQLVVNNSACVCDSDDSLCTEPRCLQEPVPFKQKESQTPEHCSLDSDKSFFELYCDAAALRMKWEEENPGHFL
jgi:hypothetical protein